MGNEHIVSVEKESKLSIDTGRLKITFVGKEPAFLALADIAVLILAHPCISVSLGVLQQLPLAGGVIITMDEKHLPAAYTLPVGINCEGGKRPHWQAKWFQTPESDAWWAQLLKSKIRGQATVAQNFDPVLAQKLNLLADAVVAGDKECREAQAAQAYWPAFFNSLGRPVLQREKQGASDAANIALNYAYAVLRGAVARGLCAAGCCLNLGVGHCRKDNPFNLVDDFIEPLRFLADRVVWAAFMQEHHLIFTPALKKTILTNILSSTVEIFGKRYRLFPAVEMMVHSFCLALQDARRKLYLPNLPLPAGRRPQELPFTVIQYE